MIIKEFEYKLKDGRVATVRSPREKDVSAMLEYLYITAAETDFLLRYPEDCVEYTPESEKAVFDRINNSESEAMFACFLDGRVIATANVMWRTRIKTRHRAYVAITVIKEFWGQGLGTRLMTEMTELAKANENIMQIELEYIEGNERARALYEKLGFKTYAEKPNAIRLKDGTLLKEYSMMLEIKR
ncbi:MAG: GNAT family N-acetyltransferase [Clostridia bacterium]|nr:GNAT family N-acetyltransferase [Clostridia bacterium]